MALEPTKDSVKPGPHLITLIRHGETVANVAHLLQGSTDSPLSIHGQNQVDALVKSIEKSLSRAGGKPAIGEDTISPIVRECIPTEIWSSPLPRAWKLASAIHAAVEAHTSEKEVKLVARPNLEEKSFGSRECSRGGIHVTGFPVGVKPAEDAVKWRSRVREEGRAVLDRVATNTGTRNHLVIVSHGLWLSCFFDLFLSRSVRLPFADNTGTYTLAMEAGSTTLKVVCANDTSHLIGLKRQRGGIGSSASDKKQRTLGDMWKKSTT
jgi:broad specificity phosphatase PhoE